MVSEGLPIVREERPPLTAQNVAAKPSTSKAQDGNLKNVIFEVPDPKSGKKSKGKRRRFVILFEEDNSRSRIWTWVALVLLICLATIVAIVVAVLLTGGGDVGTRSSATIHMEIGEHKVVTFESCDALVSSTKRASTSVTFDWERSSSPDVRTQRSTWDVANQPWRGDSSTSFDVPDKNLQTDILVPPQGGNVYYAASNFELLVLDPDVATDGNSSAVITRVPLFPDEPLLDVLPVQLVDNEGEQCDLPYGLKRTFNASRLIMPETMNGGGPVPRMLVVLGSAVEVTGLGDNEQSSPLIYFSELNDCPAAQTSEDPAFVSTTLRPFQTAVAVFVDISVPAAPEVVSVTEYEGSWISARVNGNFLWVNVRHAAHVPYAPVSSDGGDSEDTEYTNLTDDVMPLFRYTPVRDDASAGVRVPAWRRIGDCQRVWQVQTGFSPAYPGSQLVTIASLPLEVQDGPPLRSVGEPRSEDHLSVKMAWNRMLAGTLMAPSYAFMAETIDWATSSTSAADTQSPSPTIGGQDPGTFPPRSTALLSFELDNESGALTYKNSTMIPGELKLQGALTYEEQKEVLFVLSTTQERDNPGSTTLKIADSIFSVYENSLDLIFNQTKLFKAVEPQTVLYSPGTVADDGAQAYSAYVALPFSAIPQVQVLTFTLQEKANRTQAAADFDDSQTQKPQAPVVVQRRINTRERIYLMKVFRDEKGTELLLVAGPQVDNSTSNSDSDVSLQFSIYNPSLTDEPGRGLATQQIARSQYVTEAFFDMRAARVLNPDRSDPREQFFVLPICVESAPNGWHLESDADIQLGSQPAAGSRPFVGIAIWRLNTTAGDIADFRLIPSTRQDQCDIRCDVKQSNVDVKRIVLHQSGGTERLLLVSRATVGVVAWSELAAAGNVTDDYMTFVQPTSLAPMFAVDTNAQELPATCDEGACAC